MEGVVADPLSRKLSRDPRHVMLFSPLILEGTIVVGGSFRDIVHGTLICAVLDSCQATPTHSCQTFVWEGSYRSVAGILSPIARQGPSKKNVGMQRGRASELQQGTSSCHVHCMVIGKGFFSKAGFALQGSLDSFRSKISKISEKWSDSPYCETLGLSRIAETS